jgi:hypothetical protein
MTIKAEVEPRQAADRAEVSNNYRTGFAHSGFAPVDRHSSKLDKPGFQGAKTLVLPQFSVRQVYITVGLYGILLSSALWASVNVLQWVWHKLLSFS